MPTVTVLGGPNGAGKTTTAFTMLPDLIECSEFVNADAIAQAISPFDPESAAFEAGRIMVRRLQHLKQLRKDFVFETTMASKSFSGLLQACREEGYTVNLLFIWLESASLARERVAQRVRKGGHNIPLDVIDRRYRRGIENFLSLYLPLSDFWACYNNSGDQPILVAEGNGPVGTIEVYSDEYWTRIQEVVK